MSTYYFACGVYGIELDAEDLRDFLPAFTQHLVALEEDEDFEGCPYEAFELAEERALADCPGFLPRLREKYGLPGGGVFCSGSEDETVHRSATSPETWLFGIALLDFPYDDDIPPAFRERAEWHTWVEAG